MFTLAYYPVCFWMLFGKHRTLWQRLILIPPVVEFKFQINLLENTQCFLLHLGRPTREDVLTSAHSAAEHCSNWYRNQENAALPLSKNHSTGAGRGSMRWSSGNAAVIWLFFLQFTLIQMVFCTSRSSTCSRHRNKDGEVWTWFLTGLYVSGRQRTLFINVTFAVQYVRPSD